MNSSGSVKIITAFALGVVLALGGAVLYMKSSEKPPSQPVAAQTAATQQPTPSELPNTDHAAAQTDETTEAPPPEPPAPAVPAAPRKTHAELSSLGHKYTHTKGGHASQAEPATQSQDIAQNTSVVSAPPNPYPQNSSQSTSSQSASSPLSLPAPPQYPASRTAVQEPTSRPEAMPEKRQPQSVTLDAGTSIVIRLTQAISTDRSNPGDTFRGTLQMPIIRNGFVIAEKGSFVTGKVVSSQQPGKMKGGGDLSVQLTEINTTDGQRIPVQTSIYDKQGSSSEKSSAAKMGGGAALGAIIGAIAGGGRGAAIGAGAGAGAGTGAVLLGHNKPVTLPSETELTFRLSVPVTITERLN